MSKPCVLCGGVDHRTVSEKDRHGNPLHTVLCMGCGIITNDPIPTDAELADFYRKDYRTEYKGAAEPRLRQVWRNFERLENHIEANWDIYGTRKNGLDLGSGSGEFMFLAGKAGIKCQGVEPNEGYAQYSRNKLGLDVLNQTLEDTDFPARSFDLIRLSHVLEHMRDPVRSLKVLHDWLSDDGVLYIEVPDIEHDAHHKLTGRMFHYGHIFNYNPVTLRLAAGLAGFEELDVSKSRHSDFTRAFFRKSKSGSQPSADLDANAKRLMAALEGHNKRILPAPKSGTALARFFSTMKLRLSEVLNARKHADHRSIAEASASNLRARLPRP